ncbi:hypothetical protein [Rudaea sp.]|uniref:hypothetical protein n=1 Tax=Rudaea sp. TaxID=2136325 RepID=UPI002ED0DFD5
MLPRDAVLVAILMAAGMTAAKADQPAAIYSMEAVGEVQIATDGHVSDYRLASKLPDEVAKLIDQNVRGWHFEPILVDGQPVVARTTMHIHLTAEPIAGGKDNYKLRIASMNFGEPRHAGQMKPPHYPMEAVAAHLGARVLLYLRLDENGKVVEVQPYQTSLGARTRSEHEAESWRKVFERSSVAAAKEWRYDMTETVDGKPMGTTVIVPIEYGVGDTRAEALKENKWKGYVPGPIHPAPWMNKPGLAANQDLSELKGNESLSLDSRFKLKNDVVGKTL